LALAADTNVLSGATGTPQMIGKTEQSAVRFADGPR
jgi:hypothetical protein